MLVKFFSDMLLSFKNSDTTIFGIPAGGVPCGCTNCIKPWTRFRCGGGEYYLPWNTESGYGAVAFDGTVKLNNEVVSQIGLTEEEIKKV